MRASRAVRRKEQASYQRAYRAEQTAHRKPSRDDVARLALHSVISSMLEQDDGVKLFAWSDALVNGLVAQGYERNAARSRVDGLIDRYADGWVPQRKVHLTRRPPPD